MVYSGMAPSIIMELYPQSSLNIIRIQSSIEHKTRTVKAKAYVIKLNTQHYYYILHRTVQ